MQRGRNMLLKMNNFFKVEKYNMYKREVTIRHVIGGIDKEFDEVDGTEYKEIIRKHGEEIN